MPEGPSIIILKEQALPFKGKKVIDIGGNTKVELAHLKNKKITDIRSFGKNFLIIFGKEFIRIHFMLFGSYRINEGKDAVPRLSLKFTRGELNFYACSVKLIKEDPEDVYDFESDVMSDQWNSRKAIKKLKAIPDTLVCDALLDQHIFAGVGNIIKNEVLFRIKVNPKSKVGALPAVQLRQLVKEAKNYSFDFYRWKKEYTLKKHWLAHTKKKCPRDGSAIIKEYLGKTNRRTFYCRKCQLLYK